MKTIFTHLTVVALLLSQVWLAAVRGQVVCMSNHRCESSSCGHGTAAPVGHGHGHACSDGGARDCDGGHRGHGGHGATPARDACAHDHAGLLAVAPGHDACTECVHVTTPDLPSLVGGHGFTIEPPADAMYWVVALTWLALPPDDPPMVGQMRPPADPTQLAERRALKSQRLLI